MEDLIYYYLADSEDIKQQLLYHNLLLRGSDNYNLYGLCLLVRNSFMGFLLHNTIDDLFMCTRCSTMIPPPHTTHVTFWCRDPV